MSLRVNPFLRFLRGILLLLLLIFFQVFVTGFTFLILLSSSCPYSSTPIEGLWTEDVVDSDCWVLSCLSSLPLWSVGQGVVHRYARYYIRCLPRSDLCPRGVRLGSRRCMFKLLGLLHESERRDDTRRHPPSTRHWCILSTLLISNEHDLPL